MNNHHNSISMNGSQAYNFADIENGFVQDIDGTAHWQMENSNNSTAKNTQRNAVSGPSNNNNNENNVLNGRHSSFTMNDSINNSVEHVNINSNVIPQQESFQYSGNPMKQQHSIPQQINTMNNNNMNNRYNANNTKDLDVSIDMSKQHSNNQHIPSADPSSQAQQFQSNNNSNKSKRQYSNNNKNKGVIETMINNFQTQPGFSGHRNKIPTPLNVGPKSQYSQDNSNNTSSINVNGSVPYGPPVMMAPVTVFPYCIRKYMANMAAIKFHDMIDMINLSVGRITQPGYWQRCMKEVFTQDAIIRYSKTSTTEIRQFDFLVPLVPILFVTLGRLGVVRIEVLTQQLKTELISDGTIFFDCPRCTFTYHYPDGSYITHFVQLKGLFNSDLKVKWGDLHMHSFVPGIEWNSLESLISNNFANFDIFKELGNGTSNTQDDTKVKNEEKGNNTKKRRKPEIKSENDMLDNNSDSKGTFPPNFEAITQLRSHFSVFRNVSVFGSQEGLMRVMQVSTVMSSLRNLWMYQKLHKIDSPLAAMSEYVKRYKQNIKVPFNQQNRPFYPQPQQQQQHRATHTPVSNKFVQQEREISALNQTRMGSNGNIKTSMTPVNSMSAFSHDVAKLQASSMSSGQTSEGRPLTKKRRTSCISPRSRGTPGSVASSYDYSPNE
ncbi:hypothetical protein C6P45_002205 [Maudiozyma exigua]|uniref:Morphogenetic regulator of filamentous growth protein 1 n=1 Tax=Maudiozyma exigua TaxID=34358 RepID=A0A9P6VZX5_MAUEX|nr:hypothetical protein C6P45_002205 [Kazachstania exigua]